MGLPLYIAPVESDLRNKASASHNSPTHGPNRIRRVRRSTEALIESRRRAIMAANANATILRSEDVAETQLALYRERQQHLDDMHRRVEERHLQNSLWPRAHLMRARETLPGPGSNPSQSQDATPDVPHPSRESILQRFYDRLRDHEQITGLSNLGRERNTSSIPNTANTGNTASTASSATSATSARPSNFASDSSATAAANAPATTSPRPLANVRVTTASGTGGLRDEHRLWYEYIVSRSRNQATADPRYRGGREAAGVTMDDMESNDEETERNPLALLDRRWMDLPSLGSSTSQPNRTPHRRPRTTVEHYIVEGIPSASDWEMGADSARQSHARSRRASSLRRVFNASATSRRPTVGWSDNNEPASGRSRESSQSRIFGDPSHLPTAANRSLSNHAWTVGLLNMNNGGDRRQSSREDRLRRAQSFMVDGITSPPHQDDGWGTSADPVDGLGDRRRSLSPMGEAAWDTLLTTLTPDPQPPSAGTSFASTSSAAALAAAAEGQPAWASSSQPTVTQTPVVAAPPAVPSPSTRGREDAENGANEPTPVSVLVETSHVPAWFAEEPLVLGGNTSSGTTSASASQQVRSPFTVISVGADTGDESAVMFESGVEGEAPCEDSEMDDGMQRDGDEEDAAYDEEEQGEEESRAFFMGMTDGPSTRDDRLMRSAFGGSRSRGNLQSAGGNGIGNGNGNGNGSSNGNNNSTGTGNSNSNSNSISGSGSGSSQETLDILGIGGMQHIVRSLARREDIPDEWWAEAGLSRTLAREASS